jgi:lipoate-protein ligase B
VTRTIASPELDRPADPAWAYDLGVVGHDEMAATFRKLVYDVSGDSAYARVLVCEHPPSVTIGRHGSVANARPGRVPVSYVGRGGGAWPHGPGQLAVYPALPLESWGITPVECVSKLLAAVTAVCHSFDVPARTRPDATVTVGQRPVAAVGLAVRHGVSVYGFILNVNPDLDEFDTVTWNDRFMTSLTRETPLRVRRADVLERIYESLADAFPGLRTEW